MNKVLFNISDEEFQLIIKAILDKCAPEWEVDNWNEYNKIKTSLLFQYGSQR